MAIYKRGKVWWVRYTWPPGSGKQKRFSVGPKKREAELMDAEVEKDIRQGRFPTLRTALPMKTIPRASRSGPQQTTLFSCIVTPGVVSKVSSRRYALAACGQTNTRRVGTGNRNLNSEEE